MNGKIVAIFFALTALAGGVGAYVLNVYAFYDRLPEGSVTIRLTNAATGEALPIGATDVQAIDATSSPLRFRACFTLTDAVPEGVALHADPVPLTGPGWFDCYDAVEIGAALERGAATAYLGEAEVRPGVDRVVAILPGGRGFAWHQLNESLEE